MATYVPPGGTLVDTDSQNEGSALGKPVLARYTRLFELTQRGSERAVEDARASGESVGTWTQAAGPTRAVFVADKRAPSGRMELNITLFADVAPADRRREAAGAPRQPPPHRPVALSSCRGRRDHTSTGSSSTARPSSRLR